MVNQVMRFVKEDDGATAIEYGLLAALIGAALVATIVQLRTALEGTFSFISSELNSASGS